MRHVTNRFFRLATPAIGFVVTTSALAQEAEELEGIVVTARRIEERMQDVPISITLYSQEQLSNRNIVAAGDLAAYTPSLSLNSRFGGEKVSFGIRGFNQDVVTSPTVGIYFADVVAPRTGGTTGGGNGAVAGSFFDLQNVQILRGPQGTLFGRNTTGGAILLVPKKPTGDFEGYTEGTVGNDDQRRVEAVVNVPVSDSLRLRLGVDRNVRDGYLRNRSGVGPETFGDVDYSAFRLSAVADLTSNLENYTVATYNESDTHGTLARLIECERNPALRVGRAAFVAPAACNQIDRQNARGDGFYDVESSLPTTSSRFEQWQVINTTTWRTSDTFTIKNILSYAEFKEDAALNITGDNLFVVPGSFPGAPAGAPFQNNILFSEPGGGHLASQSTFTEELQFLGSSFDSRLTWQAGGYFEVSDPIGQNANQTGALVSCTDFEDFQCTGIFGAASSASIVHTRISFRNLGAYAQADYQLSDHFSVTGGIRYTRDRMEGTGGRVSMTFPTPNVPRGTCTNAVVYPGKVTLDPEDCLTTNVEESEEPTWLIGLDYKPTDDWLVYGKYARGYRQGGVNPTSFGLETWDPEYVDSYEVGTKASFSGTMRGYVNVAAFYNDLTDQQLLVTAIGKPGSGIAGGQAIVNAGKSRIQGVEVDASINLFEGFYVDVGYAYLDTKLESLTLPTLDPNSPYQRLDPRDAVGGSLALSPENRVTITARYTLPLRESIGNITIGATFTHTDTQIATISSPFGILPATDLLNLNLNWLSIADLPLDLSVFATNVTQEEFPVNVTNSYSSTGYESVITNQPRMYGVRLKFRFGS